MRLFKFQTILLLAAATATAQVSFQTFTYSGSAATFQVPAGVTSLTIQAAGAQGGATSNPGPAVGGKGATLTATFSVAPLETLNVIVGGAGASTSNFITGGGGGGASLV